MGILGASDSRERAILDAMFGSGNPATWYVGKTKTVPNDDGSNFTEPVGANYGRVAVPNNPTNFPAATTVAGRTTKKNGTPLTWPNPNAPWGLMYGCGFFLNLTGGTPEYTQLYDEPRDVTSTSTPVQLDANELEIEAD